MSATSLAWGQVQTWTLLVNYHTREYQTKWIKPDRKANIYHLYVQLKKTKFT